MMTDTASAPSAARPLPTPTPLLPTLDDDAARPTLTIRMWKGWQAELRFFGTAYLAGFVFFLAILS